MPTADRRDEILQTAARLFATKGIGATTVREIGEDAGVLSGSLYHYFPSKNGIATGILERYLRDIHERFGAVATSDRDPESVVRGLITETLLVIDEHPHPTAIYQQDRQYLRKHGLLDPVDQSSGPGGPTGCGPSSREWPTEPSGPMCRPRPSTAPSGIHCGRACTAESGEPFDSGVRHDDGRPFPERFPHLLTPPSTTERPP